MVSYFFSGLAFGIIYSAPIGVQNLYVIHSQLIYSKAKSYLVALSTIFHDVLLATLCFWGMGLALDQFPKLKLLLLTGGALFLFKIGYSLIKSFKIEEKESATLEKKSVSLLRIFLTTGAMTWLNPQALIDGTVLLGGFQATLDKEVKVFFFLGIVCASFAWFLALSSIVRFLNARGKFKSMRYVNLICGVALILFGLKLSADVFQSLSLYLRSIHT